MKFEIPTFLLFLGIIASSTLICKPEFTNRENKSCTFCHVTGTSKELNDAGKYYEGHDRSLEGYKPAKLRLAVVYVPRYWKYVLKRAIRLRHRAVLAQSLRVISLTA
jgi:hypothetical protein